MKITIEEMLVERDIISRQQLERVKEIQKSHEDKSLTDMLLLLGYTTEDVIMNCFSDRDDMEIIHLEERTADPAAIEMLPESFIVNNEITNCGNFDDNAIIRVVLLHTAERNVFAI